MAEYAIAIPPYELRVLTNPTYELINGEHDSLICSSLESD